MHHWLAFERLICNLANFVYTEKEVHWHAVSDKIDRKLIVL